MLFGNRTQRLKVVLIVFSPIAGFRARLVQPLFADILGEMPGYPSAVVDLNGNIAPRHLRLSASNWIEKGAKGYD